MQKSVMMMMTGQESMPSLGHLNLTDLHRKVSSDDLYRALCNRKPSTT